MTDMILIPARGGSKRLPSKNIKLLCGRPLIYYTLDVAAEVADSEDICVSTDSDEIIDVVRKYGLQVPFKRPASLATDTAGTYEVILHALTHFEKQGRNYDKVILLQPTSPFRKSQQVIQALSLYQQHIDMVVSVKQAKANLYDTLFEENEEGFLFQSWEGIGRNQQNRPCVYQCNGAIYIMNVLSLKKKSISQFKQIRKYIMTEEDSLDIDTPLDFLVAEAMLENRKEEYRILNDLE